MAPEETPWPQAMAPLTVNGEGSFMSLKMKCTPITPIAGANAEKIMIPTLPGENISRASS